MHRNPFHFVELFSSEMKTAIEKYGVHSSLDTAENDKAYFNVGRRLF
jgi:hypothetical protein